LAFAHGLPPVARGRPHATPAGHRPGATAAGLGAGDGARRRPAQHDRVLRGPAGAAGAGRRARRSGPLTVPGVYHPGEGWCFIHIQKTGGNSICTALGLPLAHPDKHLGLVDLADIHGREALDAAFKFAFVRNPWERLVSWWSMFDRQRAAPHKANDFGRLVLGAGPTFDAFLASFDAMPDDEFFKTEWLFRSQASMLGYGDGRLAADFIGRFEHMARDWATLAGRLGRPGADLPHVNRSPHGPYQAYYTPRGREIVARHFAADIEQFGYRFEG